MFLFVCVVNDIGRRVLTLVVCMLALWLLCSMCFGIGVRVCIFLG